MVGAADSHLGIPVVHLNDVLGAGLGAHAAANALGCIDVGNAVFNADGVVLTDLGAVAAVDLLDNEHHGRDRPVVIGRGHPPPRLHIRLRERLRHELVGDLTLGQELRVALRDLLDFVAIDPRARHVRHLRLVRADERGIVAVGVERRPHDVFRR